MGCKSIFAKNMHKACKLFQLIFDSLLNGNLSVGNNRLFIVNVSDQECTVIQLVNELIQLRHGYLAPLNALTMSWCEVKQILQFISVT